MDRRVASLPDPRPAAAATAGQVGLGVVILLAGLHKFVDPAAWAAYLAPALASRWPLDPELTMVLFGATELPVGAALLVGRYVRVAAWVVAASIAATVLELGLLVAQTGAGGDVLIRDLAVLALALTVALDAADGDPGEGDAR